VAHAASAPAGQRRRSVQPTAAGEAVGVGTRVTAATAAVEPERGHTESRPPSTPLAVARSVLASPDGAPEPDALTPTMAPSTRQRPHLALVARPSSAVPPTPPVIARATAERLAAETHGRVHEAPDGMRSVSFPEPGSGAPELAAMPVTPYTVSRELADPAPPAATPPAADAPAPAQGQARGGLDLEEAYEYFLDRFRRDLVVEREQSGHLLNENP
jgi:hypothetical protein